MGLVDFIISLIVKHKWTGSLIIFWLEDFLPCCVPLGINHFEVTIYGQILI